ncbi:hypothetical protein HPO96_29115 [Kribbella sandramycini]|uniref:ATP/GTP-binding protein n=1 Tax=Kribbella sandramycini TaxID=60450 RepID=A0A7Y4L4R8_9ACTN|nr:hypothetical protein [Kribbella sandramycini]MBB6571672.1 hypothetical protein [Kribbella sandramycini]NOL44317.1 hypothetical protein [Kribbella sandramycini]
MRILTALAITAALLTASAPAEARPTCAPTGGLSGNGKSVTGELGCSGSERTGGKKDKTKWTKGGQPPLCVWVPQPGYVPPHTEPTTEKGMWYARFCKFGDFQTLEQFEAEMASWGDFDSIRRNEMMRRAGIDYRFFVTPPPTRPTARQVMEYIAAETVYPQTYLAVNPKAGDNVIDVPTWIWLTDAKGAYQPAGYDAQEKNLVRFGYSLRWRIVPKLAVDTGAGDISPACTGIGVPWSATADPADACTVTYGKSGTYTLAATMSWTVEWWLDGEAQDSLAGPDNTASTTVTVKEIQTVVGR